MTFNWIIKNRRNAKQEHWRTTDWVWNKDPTICQHWNEILFLFRTFCLEIGQSKYVYVSEVVLCKAFNSSTLVFVVDIRCCVWMSISLISFKDVVSFLHFGFVCLYSVPPSTWFLSKSKQTWKCTRIRIQIQRTRPWNNWIKEMRVPLVHPIS